MAADLSRAQSLGYVFGHAYGSVEPELARLAELEQAQASAPNLNALADAVEALDAALAAMPDGAAKNTLVEQASDIRLTIGALEDLGAAVDHQRRAVEEAKKMPTVLVVAHPDLPHFRIYVDENDQAAVDAIADETSHKERVWQEHHLDEMAAAASVAGKGYQVERDPGSSSFTVDGVAKTAKQLAVMADTAKPKPSVQQKVAQVLLTAPELGEATRAALEQALGGPQA